ncbi:MAG: hypothetical protein KGS72_13005 [Cyanobacteria bacterium REEB67]|nr:hypothetical protein [Cyanobacteria bacterium REEB67]
MKSKGKQPSQAPVGAAAQAETQAGAKPWSPEGKASETKAMPETQAAPAAKAMPKPQTAPETQTTPALPPEAPTVPPLKLAPDEISVDDEMPEEPSLPKKTLPEADPITPLRPTTPLAVDDPGETAELAEPQPKTPLRPLAVPEDAAEDFSEDLVKDAQPKAMSKSRVENDSQQESKESKESKEKTPQPKLEKEAKKELKKVSGEEKETGAGKKTDPTTDLKSKLVAHTDLSRQFSYVVPSGWAIFAIPMQPHEVLAVRTNNRIEAEVSFVHHDGKSTLEGLKDDTLAESKRFFKKFEVLENKIETLPNGLSCGKIVTTEEIDEEQARQVQYILNPRKRYFLVVTMTVAKQIGNKYDRTLLHIVNSLTSDKAH